MEEIEFIKNGCEKTNYFNGEMKAEKNGKHLENTIKCSIMKIE